MTDDPLHEAIDRLQRSYLDYMANLKAVLDFGDANIEGLIACASTISTQIL